MMIVAILIMCIVIPAILIGYEYLDEKEKENGDITHEFH